MKQRILIGLAILALTITLASCSSNSGQATGTAPQAQAQQRPPMPPGGSPFQAGTKLADAPFASNAYLISDEQLADNATKALTGFARDRTVLDNGSVRVTLTAKEQDYQDQTYIVTPGEKLYFLEMSLGDDSGDNDYRLGDDHAILVDANGTIVG